MAHYKYSAEHAINLPCTWAGMLAPAYLNTQSAPMGMVVPPCNIYIIGRRPRLTIDAAAAKSKGLFEESIELTYFADWGDGEPAEVHLSLPNMLGRPVSIDCNDARNVMRFRDERGRLLMGMPVGHFLSWILRQVDQKQRMQEPDVDGNLLDLDVVYVGQSMDEGGAGEKRLQTHHTLQKILADTSQHAPHLEVQVVMMAFDDYQNIALLGPWDASATAEESDEHVESVNMNPFARKERTALVEAALINHFSPIYNKKLKGTFPSPLHESYQSVYELDYNTVGVELDCLSTMGVRLKSNRVEPAFMHLPTFPLHSPEMRQAFFDLPSIPS